MNPDLEPPGQGVFAAAVQWVEGTLLGSLATVVAVIAVVSVGLLLLSGRIDVRRGAQVIFGCFVLFGASTIAAGIMRMVGQGKSVSAPVAALPPPPTYVPAAAKQVPYDPYAGAALPSRP